MSNGANRGTSTAPKRWGGDRRNMAMLIVGVAAVSVPELLSWAEFKSAFNKRYNTTEERARQAIYDVNVRSILSHNTKGSSYRMGVNSRIDLSPDEFRARNLRDMPPISVRNDLWRTGDVEGDDSIDWRTRGAVTPVKDQVTI